MSSHNSSDSEVDDEDGFYVPNTILEEVREGGKRKYLIEWEDWPLGAATLEPIENFDNNAALLASWEKEKRRRRMDQSPKYDLKVWKKAQDDWDKTKKEKRDEIVERNRRERLAAEALGDYGEASASDVSDDEADEGPIEISDDSDGRQRRAPNLGSRPLPDDSDDEDETDDDDLIVAPNGAKLSLTRPIMKKKKTNNDNVGITGYQGNANRAPLPSRQPREGPREMKPAMRSKPVADEKEKKGPKKMQDRIAAIAAGQQVDNGSRASFRNMSQTNMARKMGQGLADRSLGVMMGRLRNLAEGGRLVDSANPKSASHSSMAPAAPSALPATTPVPAPTVDRAGESTISSDDDDTMNLEDSGSPDGGHRQLDPSRWPRTPKPALREKLKRQEKALEKEIFDRTAAIQSSMPSSTGDTEAAVFPASRRMSNTLLPARTSNGVVPPSVPIGAMKTATANFTSTHSRPQIPPRPKDSLFLQTTRDRVISQNRPPPLISRIAAGSPTNVAPHAMASPGQVTQSAPRNVIPFEQYQASRRTSAPMDVAPMSPVTPVAIFNSRITQSTTQPHLILPSQSMRDLLGCSHESLLPHLATANKGNLESEHAYFYLLFPTAADKLAQAITKWLRASSNWAKVFHCQQPGSWTRFVELTTPKGPKLMGGCLIVHSSLKQMIPRQPQLTTYLANGNNNVWCAEDNCHDAKTIKHVFQAGGAILITPKMFETQPQKVNHILEWFYRQKLPKTRGKIWKLAILRNMTTHLHGLWIRSAKIRDRFIAQYQKSGENEDDIDRTLASKTLSKLDIECMHRNLSLVQKIKQYGVTTGAVPGTKEAEHVFVEVSSAINYDDDVEVVDGFASYALSHWEKTREWIVIGTGNVKSHHKGVQDKAQPVATGLQSNMGVEQSANDKEQQSSATLTNDILANNTATAVDDNGRVPIVTDANIDLCVFMVQTGVERDVAEEYFKGALGDIGLALKLHEIDAREGNVIKTKFSLAEASKVPRPDHDGDINMEDGCESAESGEIGEGKRVNGAAPPTPSDMVGSPSKQLQAEIASSDMAMEDAVSMIPDTAPPPPPTEDAPVPPPSMEVAFKVPSPIMKKKSPPGQENQAATAPAPTTRNDVEISDSTLAGAANKPQVETRPTLEWYAERRATGNDWKHIWVFGYDKAVSWFQIKMAAPTATH